MTSKNKIFLVSFLCLIGFGLRAQSEEPDPVDSDETVVTSQYWLDYNMKSIIDENRSVSGFVGYRTLSPHTYSRFVVAPTYNIRHRKSPEFMNLKKPLIHSFHLGGGAYYTNNFDTEDKLELRLMQGLQIFTPELKGIYLKNYLRLEERFQKTFDDSYWSFGLRLRYKISTVFEWKKRGESFNRGVYLPMSIEFFFNFNPADRDNDQIRISPGIGYKFNNEWRCEFLVSYHNIKDDLANDGTSNDFVFRLRLFKSNVSKGLFIRDKEGQMKELMEE